MLVPLLCGLVQMLDGYDLSAIGLAALSRVLPPAAITETFALSSVGIMVGAVIAGPIADRFGRRPIPAALGFCVRHLFPGFRLGSLARATGGSAIGVLGQARDLMVEHRRSRHV